MTRLPVFYTDEFVLPLPDGHRFPMDKYRRLRERLAGGHQAASLEFRVPDRASRRALELAHDPAYVDAVIDGTLDPRIQRRIGFPWSEAMVERSRRSVGATMAAAAAALERGIGVNLAGGTHHAFYDYGGGFCVFNDTVVAARWLLDRGLVRQVLVVDLDVHQGDGTAALCHEDNRIFTLSVHGAKNYPARKLPSDLDVALPDEADDDTYLEAMRSGVRTALDRARPDFVFYLAGADPYTEDRYGRLAMSKAGLAKRDRWVLETLAAAALPTAVAMAGGYAPDVDDIVDIHERTVLTALARVSGHIPAS
ncbi:MAG: histone deacetylase [Pseudomonadota bacterium]